MVFTHVLRADQLMPNPLEHVCNLLPCCAVAGMLHYHMHLLFVLIDNALVGIIQVLRADKHLPDSLRQVCCDSSAAMLTC